MSTPKPNVSLGGLCTFNVAHGFAEALLRGMRSSFLSDPDYHHLTQCETLDDVRLNLTETDYSDVLADSNTLTPNSLQKAAVEKVRLDLLAAAANRPTSGRFPRLHFYVCFVPVARTQDLNFLH
jgi:ATP synthase (C/AC39) subunit